MRNPWLVENRFTPATEVFATDLVPDDWSWTNVLLVAEKPLRSGLGPQETSRPQPCRVISSRV
ncbi:hypothetical protein [[Pseudopropionibacterium] massiliense]|uniref:hypothetical protein n=1 Tax=[Pseudopropionibacterium] massiliense TaxID=2220000 RepID=UPI00102FECFD|nr:hypothetical protein [[Pseudopropionibacterium] massiliense]